MGLEVAWPNKARWGGFGPWKKNLFNNRAGSGSWVLARESGPGIKKPDPLPFLIEKDVDCKVFLFITR